MPKIFSALPQPVKQALQEVEGFEFSDSPQNSISIPASSLPTAPFKLGEVIDSINSFLSKPIVSIHGISFNLSAKTASRSKISVPLTEKETEIINLLYNSEGSATKEDMLAQIWQYASNASTNTAETHIYRLRQKLTENFGIPVIDTLGNSYIIKKT